MTDIVDSMPGEATNSTLGIALSRRPTWQIVLVVLLIAVGFRLLVTESASLTREDLARFEATSGVDLPEAYGDLPFFLLWTRGDGQAFVTLAADPLIEGPAQGLKVTDIRVTRMGYSLAGLMLAGGRTDLIPLGLFLANVLAVAVYSGLTAHLARRHDRRCWWLLANPALLIGFVSDSAEPLGLALALAAVVVAHPLIAGVASFLTGTVRPELVGVMGVGRRPLVSLAGGGLAVVAMQSYAFLRLGPEVRSGMNVSFPVSGYLEAMTNLSLVDGVLALGVLAWALATIVVGFTSRSGWARFSWIAYGLLIASLSPNVIHSGMNTIRVSGGLFLLWLVPVWNESRSDSTLPVEQTGSA